MSEDMTLDEMEAFIAKHGIVAFLDHLGLDGAGNTVNHFIAVALAADQLDRALMQGPPPPDQRYHFEWLNLRNALAKVNLRDRANTL